MRETKFFRCGGAHLDMHSHFLSLTVFCSYTCCVCVCDHGRTVDRIYNSLVRAPDGSDRELPLVIPRPVPGLISRRVLVQDFLHGVYVDYRE